MAIVINNNIASLTAQRNLAKNTKAIILSIERLSSGYKINKASDDAAGLSISESLRGQIRGNTQALGNIQDGINLLQVAESGLTIINENIQRIRELTVQAANDTNSSNERTSILLEINARLADIDRISNSTTFNNINLLDGSHSTLCLQIGANSTFSTNVIDVAPVLGSTSVTGFSLELTGVTGGNWATTQIRSYLNVLDSSLSSLLQARSSIGAMQNRLDSALNNLTVMNENIQASESRIRDVDIAQETADLTKNQILQQASTSVLAQANNLPKLALSLLQG